MKKPNIILIMTDQQRFDSISAYGNKEVSTPNIDKLAARGVIFDRAYAECPECVPARHSLICGQNALRAGVLSNAAPPLSPDTPTIMSVLRKNGYLTQAVGKMHFIPAREHFGFHNMKLSEEVPASVEEDEYHTFLSKEGYLDYVSEPHGMRGQMYYIPQVSPLPKEKHATWWTASESIKFLDQMKEKDKPFFLFSSFIKPHPPFDPPSPYQYKYLPNDFTAPVKGGMDNVENWNHYQITQNLYKCNITDPYFLKTMKAFYHSCIAFVDDMVGKIFATLKENDQLDNTIVVFCSDQGARMCGYDYGWSHQGYR